MKTKIGFKNGSVIETIETKEKTVRSKKSINRWMLEDMMKTFTPWQKFRMNIMFLIEDIQFWFRNKKSRG